MNKQVTAVHFESTHFTGGDENTGQRYTIDIQDMGLRIAPEFYTGSASDTALSGKKRQNLRGLRPTVELRYQKSLQAARMRSLFNDILRAFVTNNAVSIDFYPDASAADKFAVVLDAGEYNVSYTNTIGRFSPSLTLVALDEITEIPSYLEG